MDNHPVGWPLLYETPLGMFWLYGRKSNALFLHDSCQQESRCDEYEDAVADEEPARSDASADQAEDSPNESEYCDGLASRLQRVGTATEGRSAAAHG